MSEPAIIVENLSKAYRLGQRANGGGRDYRTFRDAIIDAAKAPFRRLRQLGRDDTTGDDTFWALKDVSFEVQPGEVVGIIGRNGAGKSTLLKILSRITEPTGGRITLRGRVASLLEVGTGFHPELTGRENIFLNGSILGMKRTEITRQFDEIVDFSGVSEFIDTPVKRYSSGMYVRLAFAVAAHLEPEILIIDEVLAVGDSHFQKKCMGKMGEVAKEGRTVLFVSHNMTAISSLCEKVIWLDKGKSVARGSSETTVSSYLQAGISTRRDQFWPNPELAPGNAEARLRRVRVSSRDSDPARSFNVTTPLQIEFEYLNNIEGAHLNLSAFLYNIEGECIFNTFSPPQPMPKGLVFSQFALPGNLLNDGIYLVRVLVVRDEMTILIDADQTIMFEVQDVPRNVAWHGKWSGSVRPRLEWKTSTIPAAVATK